VAILIFLYEKKKRFRKEITIVWLINMQFRKFEGEKFGGEKYS